MFNRQIGGALPVAGCQCSNVSAEKLKTPLNSYPVSLIPHTPGWFRVLRFGLLLSSIGWGISFFFTYSSWDSASDQLYLMGAGYIGYRPLLDYWLKMASATFGCIGIASALACLRPTLFEGLVWLLGPFHAFIGVVLTVSAISNNLRTDRHPTFLADITFCFITAILISLPLILGIVRRKTQPDQGGEAGRPAARSESDFEGSDKP